MAHQLLIGFLLLAVLCLSERAVAEPFLAVRSGLSCTSCHINATGGGLRNAFGRVYGQVELPAKSHDSQVWNGTMLERIMIGGDVRASAQQSEIDDRDDSLGFGVDRATLYGAVTLNEYVTLYVDQQVAPGGSLNREAWLRTQWGQRYVKVGRMFLPFGWRLEDDSAFVRQITGVTMTQGDDGIEIGDSGGWFDWQLAATNGNGGGVEIDDGKLFTARGAVRGKTGRIGISALHNHTDTGERRAYGVFAGAKTGPISWLAELDRVENRSDGLEDSDSTLALVEANLLVRNGHNLKFSAELWQLDDALDTEDRFRYSLVYELFPWSMTQLRVGVRVSQSDDSDSSVNNEFGFIQLHAYF